MGSVGGALRFTFRRRGFGAGRGGFGGGRSPQPSPNGQRWTITASPAGVTWCR